MTIGSFTTGTDITSVTRMASLVREGGPRFLGRWFTPAEIVYCSSKAFPARHLAARFAAKEAVLKTFGARWTGPLPWRCIEILTDSQGLPSVRLTGAAEHLAAQSGVEVIEVSLSHTDEYATATAIAVRRARQPDESGASQALAQSRGADDGVGE
jgi:holo-[acyl-carrier protein] synthase